MAGLTIIGAFIIGALTGAGVSGLTGVFGAIGLLLVGVLFGAGAAGALGVYSSPDAHEHERPGYKVRGARVAVLLSVAAAVGVLVGVALAG